MSKLIVIYGNVSSGKGTLATQILMRFPNAIHYCSDGIRSELSNDIGGKSKGINKMGVPFNTFATLQERVEFAMSMPGIVVADSTGMSNDFVKMVNGWRNRYQDITIVRLYCDLDTWIEREKIRSDRWKLSGDSIVPFEMPARAYHESYQAKFDDPPDIEINTSTKTPEEVFDEFFDQL